MCLMLMKYKILYFSYNLLFFFQRERKRPHFKTHFSHAPRGKTFCKLKFNEWWNFLHLHVDKVYLEVKEEKRWKVLLIPAFINHHSTVCWSGVIQQQNNGFNKHRLAPVRFKDNLKRIKRKFQANSCGIFMVSVRVKIGGGDQEQAKWLPLLQ